MAEFSLFSMVKMNLLPVLDYLGNMSQYKQYKLDKHVSKCQVLLIRQHVLKLVNGGSLDMFNVTDPVFHICVHMDCTEWIEI